MKTTKITLIIFAVLSIGILLWMNILALTQMLEERLLPKLETVRVVGEQLHGLRDFNSIDELKAWLIQDTTNNSLVLKPNKEGIIKFNERCEEFALQLQNNALSDGFKMSFAVMSRIDYYNKFNEWIKPGTLHAVNLVIIGNDVYLIEPQKDEFWKIAYLE